jgi:hypothetical protein
MAPIIAVRKRKRSAGDLRARRTDLRVAWLQGETVVVEEWLDVDEAPSGAIARCSLWLVDSEPSAFVLFELLVAFDPLAPLE